LHWQRNDMCYSCFRWRTVIRVHAKGVANRRRCHLFGVCPRGVLTPRLGRQRRGPLTRPTHSGWQSLRQAACIAYPHPAAAAAAGVGGDGNLTMTDRRPTHCPSVQRQRGQQLQESFLMTRRRRPNKLMSSPARSRCADFVDLGLSRAFLSIDGVRSTDQPMMTHAVVFIS